MHFVARRLLGACSAALLLSYPLLCQTFVPPKHYGPFTDSFQLKTGDFNRDGAADLVGNANFNNGSQTELVVYMNNGSGGFLSPSAIAGTTGAFGVVVGDFNQDGNLDIAFGAPNASVGVAYGNGKGGFAAPVFHAVNGDADSLVVGDFNNDGKQDIATLSNTTKAVTILTNTGSSFSASSFAVPLYYSSLNSGYPPDTVSSLVAGDFNGNHQTDLAYMDQCADSSCGPGLARIYTLMNASSKWTPNLLPEQVSGFGELDAADVDLDGKVDLLVSATTYSSTEVYVDYSNGNGTFQQVYLDDYNASSGDPQGLVVGDFNNDGIEDVAGYTNMDGYGNPYYGFDIYTGKGGRSGFNGPVHFADNTTVSLRGGFAAGFFDKNGTKDVAEVDANGLAVFLNTTSTANDPCAYPSGTGIRHCLPANGGSGTSPVHILDAYKASAQPALRIEFWVDGHKVFQEYGDLLNTYVSMAKGTHQLSVVGVDATGKYVKSNTTYKVK